MSEQTEGPWASNWKRFVANGPDTREAPFFAVLGDSQRRTREHVVIFESEYEVDFTLPTTASDQVFYWHGGRATGHGLMRADGYPREWPHFNGLGLGTLRYVSRDNYWFDGAEFDIDRWGYAVVFPDRRDFKSNYPRPIIRQVLLIFDRFDTPSTHIGTLSGDISFHGVLKGLLREPSLTLTGFPQPYGGSPKEDGTGSQHGGEKSDKESLMLIHERHKGTRNAAHTTTDVDGWLAFGVGALFGIPILALFVRRRVFVFGLLSGWILLAGVLAWAAM